MKTQIIYATGNPGKEVEIGRFFRHYGIDCVSIKDLVDTVIEPDETGQTLGENAMLKVRAYAKSLASSPALSGAQTFVLADDTGLYIDGLNGEPGIRIRRWAGHKMSDEELIQFVLSKMDHLHGNQRTATFRTTLCLMPIDNNGLLGGFTVFEGSLKGSIRETPADLRIRGFPLESLFDSDCYRMLLGDMHLMDDSEKMRLRIFNHRERALEGAAVWIKSLM